MYCHIFMSTVFQDFKHIPTSPLLKKTRRCSQVSLARTPVSCRSPSSCMAHIHKDHDAWRKLRSTAAKDTTEAQRLVWGRVSPTVSTNETFASFGDIKWYHDDLSWNILVTSRDTTSIYLFGWSIHGRPFKGATSPATNLSWSHRDQARWERTAKIPVKHVSYMSHRQALYPPCDARTIPWLELDLQWIFLHPQVGMGKTWLNPNPAALALQYRQ